MSYSNWKHITGSYSNAVFLNCHICIVISTIKSMIQIYKHPFRYLIYP